MAQSDRLVSQTKRNHADRFQYPRPGMACEAADSHEPVSLTLVAVAGYFWICS